MSEEPISDHDRRVLLAHKVFEKEKAIFAADREARSLEEQARTKRARTRVAYHEAVARAVGCRVEDLQFSDSNACFSTRLISHCVWDLRPNPRWPLCIFCGCPRDGD